MLNNATEDIVGALGRSGSSESVHWVPGQEVEECRLTEIAPGYCWRTHTDRPTHTHSHTLTVAHANTQTQGPIYKTTDWLHTHTHIDAQDQRTYIIH